MRAAYEIAGIEPPISFHILRHTYASLYLMSGGSVPALAAQLGHADTRMTMKQMGNWLSSAELMRLANTLRPLVENVHRH